jgi:hypothetical protein
MAVDTELVNALKAAKTKPMFFAFVAKGTECKLLVAKAKIPAKVTAEAKKSSGGGTLFKGRCQFESETSTMVFEVPKAPPGTLAASIKKVIKTDAGQTMNVEVRVNAALAEEEGDAAESQEAAPPATPPADPRAALVIKRLNTISAGIKAALAGPNKAKVQTLFVATNAAIKNHDYPAAEKSLDELEPLVTGTSAGAGGAPPPGSEPDGATVMKRLNALTADIKAALAGPNKAAVQTRFVAVNTQIKNHDYAGADKTLDELEGLVKGPRPSGDGAPGTAGKFSVMKLGKARIEWGQLASKAIADIGNLMELIEDEFGDDPNQKDQLANAKKRVEKLVADLKDELSPALDNVLNGQDETQRKPLIETAKGMLAKYMKILQSDPIMTKLDGNEVMPDMQVAAPMQAKLQEISAALG